VQCQEVVVELTGKAGELVSVATAGDQAAVMQCSYVIAKSAKALVALAQTSTAP